MFYSSSFISLVLAFMMFLGHQGQTVELVPNDELPPFSNIQESKIPHDYDYVSVELFDRLDCKKCSLFALSTLPKIRALSHGNDKIELRLFFVPNVEDSIQLSAATALKCASDQNAFWDMHTKIHQNYDQLNSRSFTQFSNELGLDIQQMNKCQKEGVYRQVIEDDIAYAQSSGIVRSPTIFINQYQLNGDQPFENIERFIKKALLDIERQPVHSTVIVE